MPAPFRLAIQLVLLGGLTSGCFVKSNERTVDPGTPTDPVDGDPSDTSSELEDSDGDGVEDALDCAPADPSVFPGAMEVCNGIDDNCDGTADNEAVDASRWYADVDTDGAGDPDTMTEACAAPDGFVADSSDCDDGDARLGSVEQDADCDGVLTADDCDDGDAALPLADDLDCDEVPAAEDCDDADPAVGAAVADDADCDDVPTHAGGGELFRIPAQSFDMGCTAGQSYCEEDESPVMPVTLTQDYYLGETEVTQGEYEAVMGTNPSFFDSCGESCPVERVTWHMAADFTNHLSTAAGLTECYTCTGSGEETSCEVAVAPYACDGYRLPTEAEWEGAARCGEDLLYAGGNTASEVSWYDGTSTQPVGLKSPNACGLVDMSGNVREWTNDWYDDDYYRSAGRTDPEGAVESSRKVRRGGAYFHENPSSLRVADRSALSGETFSKNQGFRVARTAN